MNSGRVGAGNNAAGSSAEQVTWSAMHRMTGGGMGGGVGGGGSGHTSRSEEDLLGWLPRDRARISGGEHEEEGGKGSAEPVREREQILVSHLRVCFFCLPMCFFHVLVGVRFYDFFVFVPL